MLDLVLKRLFFSILAGEASAAPGPRTISLNQNFFNFTHGDSLPRHPLKNGFPSLLSLSGDVCWKVCVCVRAGERAVPERREPPAGLQGCGRLAHVRR